ncbi:MAG: hypothetical protein IK130_09460, partial [Oscillospiraceae bacterium]|nr:hypothetical protein [Oscillospiraceae bacterium]
MTEKDLLRVIQNADGKFYEEAEQDSQQTHTPAIRRNVTRRIIAVASAAAVLAVSVSAGIYASRNKGLTVGTSQNDIESIVEQVTNVRTDAMQTALPAAPANELGGHGPIRMSVNNLIMKDDENWYINCSAAAISDKEYLKLNALGEAEKERYNSLSGLWPDKCGSGEYYYYDTATRTVSLWNGTETPEKLFTLNDASEDGSSIEEYAVDLHFIAKLSDHRYLCCGYLRDRSTQERFFFWNMHDLEEHFIKTLKLPEEIDGATFLPPINVFSDGAQGVYLDDIASESDYVRGLRQITLTKDNVLVGTSLNIKLNTVSGLWNGAVFTFEPTDGDNQNDYCWDYVRYDLETGEKNVLLNKVEWADENHKLLFRGDQLYVAGADFLQIMDLDLKNTLSVELSVPAPLNILYLQPTQIDMCGDTIIVEYRNAGLEETPIYMLCDLT